MSIQAHMSKDDHLNSSCDHRGEGYVEAEQRYIKNGRRRPFAFYSRCLYETVFMFLLFYTQEVLFIITVDSSRNVIQVGEIYQGLKKRQHPHLWHHLNVYGSDTKISEDEQIHFHFPTTLLDPKVQSEVNPSMFEGNLQFHKGSEQIGHFGRQDLFGIVFLQCTRTQAYLHCLSSLGHPVTLMSHFRHGRSNSQVLAPDVGIYNDVPGNA